MRLIDADALIAALEVDPIECPGCPEPEFLPQIIELLGEAPTVDAVPVKHGRWIWSKRDGAYLCNVCNGGYKGQPTLMGKPMFEYCPVCGAKMDGGDADDRPD